MKLLIFVLTFLFLSQYIEAQHFGGASFSLDFISDKQFSQGYTVGYQGQFFQEKRFSLTYGLQYSNKSVIEDQTGMIWCGTGLDLSTFVPPKYFEEKWQSIEIPIGLRYNILKPSRFQPYISVGIIPFYPLKYEAWRTDVENTVVKDNYLTDNYSPKIDAALEAGVGLNYRLGNHIFNLHSFVGNVISTTEFGIAIAVLRRF